MSLLWQQIENLSQNAQRKVVLAAPFIKVSVLKQIFSYLNPGIKIDCVTRWLPEDILTGVCDLEIWQVIQAYPAASLWLKSDLHAKYYSFDQRCLVGSANLTAKGLGLANLANLELLVQLSTNQPYLQNFEQELFRGAMQVTEDWFDSFQELIVKLQPINLTIPLAVNQLVIPSEAWLPKLRNPEELYLAYCGDWDNLTSIAREAAERDLSSLAIISGLSKTAFKDYIGALLLQKPIIQQLDIFVKTPQRFGAICNLLASLPCQNLPDFNPQRDWQTLMRWLLYYLPNRYGVSIPNHSEIFYRI